MTFPVVQELVGTEFFRAAAAVHARQSPPTSPVLALYGRGFPYFLRLFKPAQSVPYLADVATLEFARVLAYHAADVTPLLGMSTDLQPTGDEALQELAFEFHPSAQLLLSRFAVVSLWAAHNEVGPISDLDIDVPEAALVSRVGFSVEVFPLSESEAVFVDALSTGATFGEAASLVLSAHPNFDIAHALSILVRQRALTSICLPRRHSA
jgi:hypothetical protein